MTSSLLTSRNTSDSRKVFDLAITYLTLGKLSDKLYSYSCRRVSDSAFPCMSVELCSEIGEGMCLYVIQESGKAE